MGREHRALGALTAALALLGIASAALGADAPPPSSEQAPPAPPKATLTIEVTNLRNDKGLARFAIYRSKQDFLKSAAASGSARIKDGKATLVLENLEPGPVAVSSFHDENENLKLDTNWIGIPKEGTSFSRDAKGFMGPPKFDNAKLELPAGPTVTTLKMSYY
ncbi:MAG TPA: DUF2141 domain-containing protein [Myxococcales bacterium]|jgi:uncharacterized protein (DUF2141 family)